MAVSQEYADYILEQLSEVSELTSKKMFGGIGLFKAGKMFGMIDSKGIFRLKAGDHNRGDFEAKGMKPMFNEKKGRGMPYWEVPVDVLEDKEELAKWVEKV